jgi:hypothetical protein
MKKTIISAVVFASMFVVGAPNAQARQARQCSNASLEGAYGFDFWTLTLSSPPEHLLRALVAGTSTERAISLIP